MSLEEELICPISQELLVDPIIVPCCTRAFSRESLSQWFESSRNTSCPNCRQNLFGFNPRTEPRNIILSNIIGLINTKSNVVSNDIELKPHQWSCSLTPVCGSTGSYINVTEMDLTLKQSNFVVRPSLFIAVVDKSGSMAGQPWIQVQSALIHMLSVASLNQNIKLIIITYDSVANIVDTICSLDEQCSRIRNIGANGGTVFRSAFDKIKTVLSRFISSDDPQLQNQQNNIAGVTIAFLTDGQSGDSKKETLAQDFKNILQEAWSGPLNVHAVGFGSGCDRELLEKMRMCGNIEGIFRYAEPSDNSDTLCQKLQSLFDAVNESSVVNLELQLSDNMKFLKNNSSNIKLQFPINENNTGTFKTWVYFDGNSQDYSVKILSPLDNLTIDAQLIINSDTERKKCLTLKWLNHLVDELATEFVDLVKTYEKQKNIHVMKLHTALILQRINAIYCLVESAESKQRLDYIENQIYKLMDGSDVNIGKLYDIRFAAGNSRVAAAAPPTQISYANIPPRFQLDVKPAVKEYALRHYSMNNDGKNRNALQQAISHCQYNIVTQYFLAELDKSTDVSMLYTDNDGNTPLLLACYFGHSEIVAKLLEKYPNIDPNISNKDGETAITLAIKKRGFWKTIKTLLHYGHIIPAARIEGLKQYAIEHGYVQTGKILSSYCADQAVINTSMTDDYIRYLFEECNSKGAKIDAQSYLSVCLEKKMTDIITVLLSDPKYNNSVDVTISMMMDWCLPDIPDSPQTSKYIELCDMVLKFKPELLYMCNADGESLLFKSAERGSLPHVKYFISKGLAIDHPNNLGNSPLWIACAKRYPCIITELLQNGANVNMQNLKGNPPMYNICQKGPSKIIDILLSYGADITMSNNNGDTLILISCRNGQHEILEKLLNYADDKLINHKAHIDGFNAIMSAAEANRPECIKVLHKFGIDLNQKTDLDNKIVASATPLHIAAYYDRLEALITLLECGADPTQTDHNGLTCLHIAVMQGNINIVRVLKQKVPQLITIRDAVGYLPMAYSRNNLDMKKILVDPLLIPLIDLCKNRLNSADQSSAIEIMRRYCGAKGVLSTRSCVNIQDFNGFTPLTYAVIYSNQNVAQMLVDLGADPLIKNFSNINSVLFAKWIRNPRINTMLDTETYQSMIQHQFDNLERESTKNHCHRQIMFLGDIPKNTSELTSDSIGIRMENSLRTVKIFSDVTAESHQPNLGIEENTESNVRKIDSSLILDVLNRTTSNFTNDSINTVIATSKIFVVNLIAAGNQLSPMEIYCANIFMNNSVFPQVVNECLTSCSKDPNIIEFNKCFMNALDKMDTWTDEVFVGSNGVNRFNFQIGNTVVNHGYISSSTMWRVSVDHVTEYATKKKQGTVFIIKSKTGKLASLYSPFVVDSEVIFRPGCTFVVTNWYHGGDYIVLGQSNIRNHTYKVKESELSELLYSNRSLVIELTEQ